MEAEKKCICFCVDEMCILYIISNLCVCVCAEKLSAERVKEVMEHIWRLQEFCNSMNKVEPDAQEYAYLKAITLFSPGE